MAERPARGGTGMAAVVIEAPDDGTARAPGAGSREAVPAVEERLEVGKRRVATGGARAPEQGHDVARRLPRPEAHRDPPRESGELGLAEIGPGRGADGASDRAAVAAAGGAPAVERSAGVLAVGQGDLEPRVVLPERRRGEPPLEVLGLELDRTVPLQERPAPPGVPGAAAHAPPEVLFLDEEGDDDGAPVRGGQRLAAHADAVGGVGVADRAVAPAQGRPGRGRRPPRPARSPAT
jgi:hypothetical protein